MREVARLRAPIRAKLLTALGALVTLLIALGGIALVVVGQANARADRFVDLERRLSAYSDLPLETAYQFDALTQAVASPDASTIDAAERQLALTAYSVQRLEFVTPDEPDLVARLASAHVEFVDATTRTLDLLRAGRTVDAQHAQAELTPLADRLVRLTDELGNRAEAEIAQSLTDTHEAYVRSQIVVLMFAGASLVLAAILGLALALSIIRPLRAIGARVGRISKGDFSGHLTVENRDELGTLAADVDKMSDQLHALYDRLADQERLRLARDLHDLLGHSLSLITIKSQVARRLIASGDAARASEEIAELEGVARESLKDVRHAVDGYRQPGLVSTIAGARSALATAKIASTIEVHSDPLPTPVDATLAWAVREGVTNVIRHSGAGACSIRVTRDAGEAHLEIADDGSCTAMNAPGNGLRGLRERAAAQGGRVNAGPLPDGGFRLQLTIPL